MSNPLVKVVSALYGGPNIEALDVTATVQGILDTQYKNNTLINTFSTVISCGPSSTAKGGTLYIVDPDFGQDKGFTIRYSLPCVNPNTQLFRALENGQTLTIDARPANAIEVISAIYGHDENTIDITEHLSNYFKDPTSPLTFTIGSSWINSIKLFTDPDPGVTKTLSINYFKDGSQGLICALDGQTITIN